MIAARTGLIKGSPKKRLHGQLVLIMHWVLHDPVRMRMPRARICDVLIGMYSSQTLSFAYETVLRTAYGMILPQIEQLMEVLVQLLRFWTKREQDDMSLHGVDGDGDSSTFAINVRMRKVARTLR
jgi:hypothetical protein